MASIVHLENFDTSKVRVEGDTVTFTWICPRCDHEQVSVVKGYETDFFISCVNVNVCGQDRSRVFYLGDVESDIIIGSVFMDDISDALLNEP